MRKIRALGLSSGGLDSILSALVLLDQGVEVCWVSFETPFFSVENAKKASKQTGIPLVIKNITKKYLKMLTKPSCGYGRYMNPCLDCHALMFKLAGEVKDTCGFDFLFSGEVLGQRPMSQTRASLRFVEKNSGSDGYILRPLSAKRLEPTEIEKKGLVDRNRLLSITGRSRKPQIMLAKKYNITQYPAPAGGCLLTDKGYSLRLSDLFSHQDQYLESELELLKYGRHFRIDDHLKVIVGRTETDNRNIEKYLNPASNTVIEVNDFPGPVTVISGSATDKQTLFAASICAGYSKASNQQRVSVKIKKGTEPEKTVIVAPVLPVSCKKFMIEQN